ncbi:alkaline phosphatase D family protein [Actinomycetospora termitidis]|uniref:Alkaline phosphatase D family protein n=1 Tax=Actinomycetospora termitidis TaxID=3053470 RepID=A0ABT7MFQ0_9PSEU|nr:alkaline phosphatase D family protein [Actinomycetospora sp. Odt1-22]MDL5159503.1 alkaline phosphatase D family protein [Actinomycetospora sp. Odt1-22]
MTDSSLLVLGPLLRHVGTTTATVWVEVDRPGKVEILGQSASTFTVCGEHYALVVLRDLEPDSVRTYEVHLDGERVWPFDGLPPSRIRTRAERSERTQRVVFGSCRYPPTGDPELEATLGVDALDAYAARLLRRITAAADGDAAAAELPDAICLLGDQVYADETTPRTQQWLRERRGDDDGAGAEIADYPEYAHLYAETWQDPEVRWLLSTAPVAMIFDDHDVRDDWNTSQAWREEMAQLDWWPTRIRAGLASYWVYQHLGNMDPATLDTDDLYRKVMACEGDAYPLLEEFAARADAAVGNPAGVRWSYRWDLAGSRLLMVDSRCGRVLNDDERLMINDETFTWLETQAAEPDLDHVLVGSSIPWLMPPAISQVQTMDERSAARGSRAAEWFRQAVDLEHWPAFRASFDRLARLVERTAASSAAPATVCVLSGDVHHSYAARASFPTPSRSHVYQLTCSPVRNSVPWFMEYVFAAGWTRSMTRVVRRIGRWWGVEPEPVEWDAIGGPYFGNSIATLELTGRSARVRFERSTREGGLEPVSVLPLT